MKGIFLFPPCFDPSMPYLAPYLLSSYVNEYFKSRISDVIDLNILLILRILKTGISLEAMPPWVSENGFSSFQAVC
jgi:hypothetical protein